MGLLLVNPETRFARLFRSIRGRVGDKYRENVGGST